ncbi:MAG: hypothetical protein ACLFTH_04670 [Candidatus Woesearchaeota archaeon]
MAADSVILGIIIGVLAAILYSLRVLILVERRIARLDLNLEALVQRVFQEELKIEKEEEAIERRLGMIKPSPKKKSTTKRKKSTSARKSTKKASAKKKTSSRKKSTSKKR